MDVSEWGLSDTGYKCPTFDEVFQSKVKTAKEYFGNDICTDGNTALGKFLRVESAYDQRLYEELEKVYYSISPVTATGVSLDRAVSFARMTRNTATAAVHTVRFYGTNGYTIKKGTLVKSTGGTTFYTGADCTIAQTGTDNDVAVYSAKTDVYCTELGTVGNVTSINSLVNVDTSITSVEYIKTVSAGTNVETDADLRKRYNEIVDGLGANTQSSIKSALLKINGVKAVTIIDNATSEDLAISDNLTVASGTYAVIVRADESDDMSESIAETIWKYRPFGIIQSGTTDIAVTDESGETHSVKFSYATEKAVDVVIECSVDSDFPSNGSETIVENIREYISGLEMGEKLIHSKLYQKVYSVSGVEVVTTLTIDGDTESISASKDEIITCNSVTVTPTTVTG